MLDLDERDNTMTGTITGGSVELLECLVEESNGDSSQDKAAVYIEVSVKVTDTSHTIPN